MSRAPKLWQIGLLSVAGLASFQAAVQWRSARGESLEVAEATGEPVAGRPGRTAEAALSADMPAVTSAVTSAATSAERDASLGPPERSRVAPDGKGDPFTSRSWLPPPPPPPAPVAAPPAPKPPPPSAPPLPFAFVGMLERGNNQPQAFLAKGEALLVVAAGDTLENNTYRVESLTPQQIVITYLPMNTRQTLLVSGTVP
ncbi:hypothetical protein BH11PSE8_BH11PSE8_39950 [soil metagenome]